MKAKKRAAVAASADQPKVDVCDELSIAGDAIYDAKALIRTVAAQLQHPPASTIESEAAFELYRALTVADAILEGIATRIDHASLAVPA